jgi:hypothetical protein
VQKYSNKHTNLDGEKISIAILIYSVYTSMHVGIWGSPSRAGLLRAVCIDAYVILCVFWRVFILKNLDDFVIQTGKKSKK